MKGQTAPEIYAEGLTDGMAITLRLILGQPYADAEPYTGYLPDEATTWANKALERLANAGVTAAKEPA